MRLISILVAHLVLMAVYGQPSSNYKLVYYEDFNEALNFSNWNASDCYIHPSSFGATQTNNYFVHISPEPSALALFVNNDGTTCSTETQYTCASLNSFSYKYGYFEVRAWVPGGCGVLSAFWLWSPTNNTFYTQTLQ